MKAQRPCRCRCRCCCPILVEFDWKLSVFVGLCSCLTFSARLLWDSGQSSDPNFCHGSAARPGPEFGQTGRSRPGRAGPPGGAGQSRAAPDGPGWKRRTGKAGTPQVPVQELSSSWHKIPEQDRTVQNPTRSHCPDLSGGVWWAWGWWHRWPMCV
jgi:hypothetical protein